MRPTVLSIALLAAALAPAHARQAQAQMGAQAGAPTPQQAQQAQQNRNAAAAYLQREEAAATGSRNQATERVNQDASVPDEASGASAAGTTRAGSQAAPAVATPPSYGPVLNPRQPPAGNAPRRDPAEVHDETDTGANPAARPTPPQQQQGQPTAQQRKQAARRHAAWQAAGDPLAPRPLREGAANTFNPEPVPAPAAAPRPIVPSTSVVRGCQGNYCTDASGKSFNVSGNTGVNSSGRLCTRSGATVQCF